MPPVYDVEITVTDSGGLTGVQGLQVTVTMFDFGDAPLPYPTTLAENGARHEAIGLTLGFTRDFESDGAHSAAADAARLAPLP